MGGIDPILNLPDDKFYTLQFRTIAKYVKLFPAITLFTTHFFVCHGSIVSIYNVES
jgi:hypothetical protein